MFVREKPNKSGSTSVQIIDKSNGYKVVQTVGCSKNPHKITLMTAKAWQIIRKQTSIIAAITSF
jgi:hypothetical protein